MTQRATGSRGPDVHGAARPGPPSTARAGVTPDSSCAGRRVALTALTVGPGRARRGPRRAGTSTTDGGPLDDDGTAPRPSPRSAPARPRSPPRGPDRPAAGRARPGDEAYDRPMSHLDHHQDGAGGHHRLRSTRPRPAWPPSGPSCATTSSSPTSTAPPPRRWPASSPRRAAPAQTRNLYQQLGLGDLTEEVATRPVRPDAADRHPGQAPVRGAGPDGPAGRRRHTPRQQAAAAAALSAGHPGPGEGELAAQEIAQQAAAAGRARPPRPRQRHDHRGAARPPPPRPPRPPRWPAPSAGAVRGARHHAPTRRPTQRRDRSGVSGAPAGAGAITVSAAARTPPGWPPCTGPCSTSASPTSGAGPARAGVDCSGLTMLAWAAGRRVAAPLGRPAVRRVPPCTPHRPRSPGTCSSTTSTARGIDHVVMYVGPVPRRPAHGLRVGHHHPGRPHRHRRHLRPPLVLRAGRGRPSLTGAGPDGSATAGPRHRPPDGRLGRD